MTNVIEVVAGCFLESDDRVLMQKRPEGKDYAGHWEFPGGKVMQSEHPISALQREWQEELDVYIDVRYPEPLSTWTSLNEAGEKIRCSLYYISAISGTPTPKEGQKELKYITRPEFSDIMSQKHTPSTPKFLDITNLLIKIRLGEFK